MNTGQHLPTIINASKVAAHLSDGALLLTVSPQLAMDWKQRLVSGSACEVCETPAVLAWQAWINEWAATLDAMPVALNRMQEQWLWERVIQFDLNQHELNQHSTGSEQSAASVRGLAGHARDAYALMQEYRIDIGELACAGEEADALARWINAMRKKLDAGALAGRLLAADVGSKLLACLNQQNFGQDMPSIILAGFDVLTPMQQTLLAALQGTGMHLMQVLNEATSAKTMFYACGDVQAECNHITAKIAAVLDDAPRARIAIATSQSVTDASLLKRTLNHALMPELRCDPCSSMQAVVMGGESLSDRPMIRQLLHMLSLCGEFSLSFDAFSVLLFSPWLKGYEAERFGRAELDSTFRRYNRHRMTFKSLLNISDVKQLPKLWSVLNVMAGWDRRQRSANDWVSAVHELLKRTGFVQVNSDNKSGLDTPASNAGARRCNVEIQLMNAFRDVLISLVAVDAVGGVELEDKPGAKLTWMQFLSLLRTGCAETRLAENAKYSHVVVMPLSQMAGLKFDHVFIMGMDEEAFPPPARPYPLLPASVQKKYALPMSNGTLVYETSQLLWESVLQSASHIEISYAGQRDDKTLLASPFVADLTPKKPCSIATKSVRLEMEAMYDASPVPLKVEQSVKGGTSIIKNQSACPFRAFATHRLGIAVLGETTPGIEASSKGSLMHLALEYIWRTLERQSALAVLGEQEKADLIDASIEHAWAESHVAADSRTRSYEKKRMQGVLSAWLELELQRPEFRVVAIEQMFHMQLPEASSLQFDVNIKADRMDVDAAGRKVLIDYKTGVKQSTAKWLSDENDGRIKEPQLPQYALAAKLGVDDAVAFARVRSGDMAYEGLCGDDIGIKGIIACDGKRNAPDDWQAVLDDWKTHLNALAMEFVDGRCDVAPRDCHACKYCGLEAVCRIEEIGIEDSGDIDDAGGQA
ncbi:MAG: PD-(D/E)XK nuclease family protein [Mariprofundus sp.]|nr:PD-(D/E)XK nuclease family protein [Mariprofundus sp.]